MSPMHMLVSETNVFVDTFFIIFGRKNLRIGVSKAKFDAESDFEVRLAVAPQKPGKNNKHLFFDPKISPNVFFRRRKKIVGEFAGSKNKFFVVFARFLRSYGQTDLKIRLLAKFCSR